MIYLTNPNGRARLLPSRLHAEKQGSGSAGTSPSQTSYFGFVKCIVP